VVLGHYRLWLGGVEHNDISVKNLMYDKFNEDRGVLNDYDLAHLNGRPRPSGTECTGTMPFMALDLLTDEAWKGEIPRLYRHDCESFAWVLLWICCRYDSGKEISNAPLSGLITREYKKCFREKQCIFNELLDITPTPSYKDYWPAASELLLWPVSRRLAHDMDRAGALAGRTRDIDQTQDVYHLQAEPTPDKIIEICRNALEEVGFKDLLNTL
jgi:hypothetical protein